MAITSTKPTRGGFIPATLQLAWQALMLHEEVYTPLLGTPRPMRRGFGIILVIVFTVALAYAGGVVLNLLTMPRIDLVQPAIYEAITASAWYQGRVAVAPNFAGIFNFIYGLVWQILRFGGGYPSWLGAIYSFFSIVVFGVLNWLGYGVLSHMVARWLGGDVKKGPYLAALSLSYAPTLLLIANIIPGLAVPASLVGLWTLATNYQVIRMSFKLSWSRSVLITLLPYGLAGLFLYLAIYGGLALGLFVYRQIG